ncbi:hypothetical protein M0805_001365 [Coniferiporia weirii]|nr:hypothetical protein M0805_001365 [Coniferiporia weirii]
MSGFGDGFVSDQQFLHIKVLEVEFKENRPRYPIFVKLKVKDAPTRGSRRFEKDEVVRWDFDNYLHVPVSSELTILLQEVHTLKRNKDFAVFNVTFGDAVGKDVFSAKDTKGKALVKFTLTTAKTGSFAELLLKEAEGQLGNKRVILESLGKAGQVIAALAEVADLASDVHPAIGAAVGLVNILYEKCKQQQECHQAATDLVKELASFLPFAKDVQHGLMKDDRTKRIIEEMLELFCKISRLVIQCSSKGFLGDLLSSRKEEIDSSMSEFKKMKDTYDWCIKMEVWKSVIATERHAEEIQLRQLYLAKQAYYNVERVCLEGTRTEILERVGNWAESGSGSNIFWLHGLAGSGKSSIANSVAHMFRQQSRLPACFFCKRDDPDCRSPKNVIPTLAYFFSRWHLAYHSLLLPVIRGEDEPKLVESLHWQFELLIKQPLDSVSVVSADIPPKPWVIVIDALDECGDSADSRLQLAKFLVKSACVVPWIKVFITSRTSPEFQEVFEAVDSCQVLDIRTLDNEQVLGDIMQYTKYCANESRVELTGEQIAAFSLKASGLFIWTSTVFKFIAAEHDKDGAVKDVLSQTSIDNPYTELDKIYTTVIQSSSKGQKNMKIVKAVLGISSSHFGTIFNELYKLVSTSYAAIATSTPHLYISALSWAPTESIMIKQLYPFFCNQPLVDSGKEKQWKSTLWIADAKHSVYCVAYSPDGKHVVSGSYDNTLRIWDAHTSDAVGEPLTGHLSWVTSVAYAPDGRHIVSGSYDTTLKIWDSQTGDAVGDPLRGHLAWVTSVTYSPGGTYIVSGSDDNTLRIWDSHTGDAVGEPLVGHLASVTSVAYSLNGKYIVSSSYDNTIRIWDVYKYVTIRLLPTGCTIMSVSCSPDGRHIVSGSEDFVLKIWDTKTGNTVGGPLIGHSNRITSVAYSSDGRYIVSGSQDKTIRMWDAYTGDAVGEPLTGHSNWITSVAYSPDSQHIVTGSHDKTLRVWDAWTRDTMVEPPDPTASLNWVNSVACSPDGRFIVSGSYDSALRIWDAKTGDAVGEPLTGHLQWVNSVTYSPDGRYIVSGSGDNTLRIWDTQTRDSTVGEFFEENSKWINCVSYSPDGKHIVFGSDDGMLKIWDVQTAVVVGKPITGHSDAITSITYSPDGKHIASGSQDITLRIWDAETRSAVAEFPTGHTSWVTSIAYSPDGKHIVTGSYDSTLKIWDVETGDIVGGPLTGHSHWVNTVAYSPDGKHIVSGSSDKTLRIWNAQTGNAVGVPLTGHLGPVTSVVFSPDGRQIVSGSDDASILIWNAEVFEPTSTSHAKLRYRAFTDDGWFKGPFGELLLWVPYEYCKKVSGICKLCIPRNAASAPVQINWERLAEYTGSSWTNILVAETDEN